MKNKYLFSFILASSALVYACKDEPEQPQNNDPGKPRQELLSGKKWKVSSVISGSTDIWSGPFVASCNKDNQYMFRKDDSLTQYEMTSKCNAGDPDSTVSFYKLYNDNKQIVLNFKFTNSIALNDTADVVELNENTLKINTEYSGLPATITFTHP
jgi:hypothetical protein